MEQSKERLAILEKIAQYEKEGKFDLDVENDPPSRPLLPGECDFTGKKLSSKVATGVANTLGKSFFEGCIKRGDLVIDGVEGLENFLAVKDRALIVTANHFSIYDNYIVYKAMEPHLAHRRLYKIIREGNYTAFPGLFGYLFRHCNTLPIPSSTKVWREFTDAVSALLAQGEKILIYPEQGMWWNYRKPRPMKAGAFYFAVKGNVPVLPIFITMRDTEKVGADGFPIQAHTLHFLPALYPKDGYTQRDAAAVMARENYDAWKTVYEKVYGVPLAYTTEHEVKPVY